MSPFIWCLYKKIVTVFLYLKPFISFKRTFKKSLMLDLLASN